MYDTEDLHQAAPFRILGKTMYQPLFPEPNPWAEAQQRPRLLKDSDLEGLLQGFAFYLRLENMSSGTIANYTGLIREFALFVQAQGRSLFHPHQGDLLAFAHDLALRGHTPPHIERASTAMKRFGAFLTWCGAAPPVLDLPPKKVYERRIAPIEEQTWALLLREIHRYPRPMAPALGMVYALMGGLGLRVQDITAMSVGDVELPRIRLPGGWVRLPRNLEEHIERYLEARALWVKQPTIRQWLVLAEGRPPRSNSPILHHHYPYLAWLGLESFPLRPLYLLGGRKLIEAYGLTEARKLLGRWVVG